MCCFVCCLSFLSLPSCSPCAPPLSPSLWGNFHSRLTYWVVFGAFTIVEDFLGLAYLFKCYYALKLGFLFWLFLPGTKGAEVIYKQLLLPNLESFIRADEAPPAVTKKTQ